ncbi:MAG: hypothetical protein U0031_14140 [Thermomicrobiales bacterium]
MAITSDTPISTKQTETPIDLHANPVPRPLALARRHAALLFVLAVFLLSTFVIPVLAPVVTTDDWSYSRSAQILLTEGRLTIFPVVVATAIVPVAWGALFGLVLGPDVGVFRLSTVVMTAIGGLALYGLCRELGVSRGRGALGVATFLFNPLVFVLAFTFMTDPHFVAWMTIAVWLFARSIRPDDIDPRFVAAGATVAALAFLTRHQGALIAPAVVVALLLAHRLRLDRAGLRLAALALAPTVVAITAYAVWARSGNDATMQGTFVREIAQAGWDGTWWLVRWLPVFALAYVGFFVLPITVAAFPADHYLVRRMSRRGWILWGGVAAVIGIGVTILAARGSLMPYLPQFAGPTGLGPPDVLAGRPQLLGPEARPLVTLAVLASTLLLALALAGRMTLPASTQRSRAALVLSVAITQGAGVLPPSYHFLGWSAGSVDRYLLPLAPLTIALALWALRGIPLTIPFGWTVVALLAAVSIVGTRDYLTFMEAIWSLGDEAVAAGVPLDRLDAGAGWDGYYLYERGLAGNIAPRTKDGPWWVYMNGPATDSTYAVASAPVPGYDVIAERTYSSWLLGADPPLYLLRRQGEPGPP